MGTIREEGSAAPLESAVQAATQAQTDELKSFIMDRWQVFQQSLDHYQWAWETTRWHELLFCLVARLGEPDLDTGAARTLVALLSQLDLLGVDFLARLMPEHEDLNVADRDCTFLLQLLERSGVGTERAKIILRTLCQTALGLQAYHGGKVQQYLRRYGNQMLDELGTTFCYSDMSDEATRHAFTHWLQNVLNMPLPLSEPSVMQFCADRSISPAELVRVADELDLNLALLDDMIVSYQSERSVHK